MEKQSQLPVEYAEIVEDIVLIAQDKATVGILQKSDMDALQTTLEKIKCFKRKYTLKKLTVVNVEDKPAKEKLRLALSELRGERTSLKDYKLSVTKPYRDTVAYINSNYDKVIEAIESLEEPLIAHNKQVKIDLEAKEKEVENAKKQKLFDRLDLLTKAGITFDGSYYSVGSVKFEVNEISFNAADIESMTDGIFNSQLADVQSKVELIKTRSAAYDEEQWLLETARLEKEAADKAAFDAEQKILREEKAKFDEEKRIFEAEKEEMRLYKQKMSDEKDAKLILDAQHEADKIAKEDKEQADKFDKFIEGRMAQLHEIGLILSPSENHFTFKGVYISYLDILTFDEDKWPELVKKSKEIVDYEKSLMFIEANLKRDANNKAIAEKAIADKIAADEHFAREAQEELDASSDEVKWMHFIDQVDKLSHFSFTSKKYKFFMNTANTLLRQISALDK